jgi:Spermidine synthase tetramerisation domain
MEPQHATENTDTTEENKETDKETDDRPVKSEIFKGWFNEWIELSCGGHAMCLKIDEVLFHEKSPYQDILIFKRLSIYYRSTASADFNREPLTCDKLGIRRE